MSDALVHGIEAAMPHSMPNGPAKPVGFVACTFTDAEMNYSQIYCVFGVKKLHSYLFGHHF